MNTHTDQSSLHAFYIHFQAIALHMFIGHSGDAAVVAQPLGHILPGGLIRFIDTGQQPVARPFQLDEGHNARQINERCSGFCNGNSLYGTLFMFFL